MSLIDADKHSIDRGSPTPNRHDVVSEGAVKSHMTMSTAYKTDASTGGSTRVVFKNNAILYYDDKNRVIRVDGFIPSLAAYPVTIIAKYGYDVYVDILGISAP